MFLEKDGRRDRKMFLTEEGRAMAREKVLSVAELEALEEKKEEAE